MEGPWTEQACDLALNSKPLLWLSCEEENAGGQSRGTTARTQCRGDGGGLDEDGSHGCSEM